jgi:hypothetical protein
MESLCSNSDQNSFDDTIDWLNDIELIFEIDVSDRIAEIEEKKVQHQTYEDMDYDSWKDRKAEEEQTLSDDDIIEEMFNSY